MKRLSYIEDARCLKVNTTGMTHLRVKSNIQHRFSINEWCGVTGDQLIGPYIFPECLTSENYPMFCNMNCQHFLEESSFQTRRQMCYQHDGAPPHFSQVIRQYLNLKFPNRCIGRGGKQNWPPRSPDMNPLDYYVCVHTEAMVYSYKVNTGKLLLHTILSAARCISNAEVLREETSHSSQKMYLSR